MLRAILEYLASRRDVWAVRMNTGAMFGEHKGKRRAVSFGVPGSPDIWGYVIHGGRPIPLFLEVKRPGGRATEAQQSFLMRRAGDGCIAAIVYDAEDMSEVLRSSLGR